jgi:hypothetical protein
LALIYFAEGCNTGGAGCPIEVTPETGRSPLLAI